MAAVPEAVRVLRSEVLDWLRSVEVDDARVRSAVGLATSEAVGNVVRHAYEDADGRIELSATLDHGGVMIRVTDSGQGLGAQAETQTGLGWPVISRVSNGVTVASDSRGTTVSMRFALPRGRPDRHGRAALSYRPMLGV